MKAKKERKLKFKIKSLQERLEQTQKSLFLLECKRDEIAGVLRRHDLQRHVLIARLQLIRSHLCRFSETVGSFKVCNCRFGADGLDDEKSLGSGCPEIDLAIRIVENI